MRFDRHGDDAAAARFGGRAVSEANFRNLPVLAEREKVLRESVLLY